MNAVRSCLLLLPLVLLGGCLDYTEEVFVHADGTGRYRVELATLGEFLGEEDLTELRKGLQDAKAHFQAHPDVSKVEVADWTEGPKQHFLLDIHAKQFSALPRLLEADAWLQLEQAEGGKQLKFVRVLEGQFGSFALRALDGRRSPNLATADDAARTTFSRVAARRWPARTKSEELDFFITFKVHAPKVTKSNGEISGGEATWRWNIEELEEKALPRLEADLDLSTRSLLPIAIVGLSFGFAFLWLRKQWKRRAM